MYDPRYDESPYDSNEASDDEGLYNGTNDDEASEDEGPYDGANDDEGPYDGANDDEGPYDGANDDEASYDEFTYDEAGNDEARGFYEEAFDDESVDNQEVVPKRKALVLGIIGSVVPHHQREDPSTTGGATNSPHGDAKDIRQALIAFYGYNENDITMLIDDGEDKQPTADNIIEEMEKLVADARPGDRFYFHYSGHGTQVPDDNGDEEDGWDECIVTSDDIAIRDDTLKEVMLDRLPVGCSFFSVFDACQSGTLLDLTHYRCNRVYVPWVSKAVPRAKPPHHTTEAVHEGFHHPTTLSSHEAARVDIPNAHLEHPHPHYCKGNCRTDPYFLKDTKPVAYVVSLSAAKDYQLSWVGRNGTSLTQALIQVLKDDRNPTLDSLLKDVSHKIHDCYLELHYQSRKYQQWLEKRNRKLQRQGMNPEIGQKVESENFQDPQISSHHPLDENTRWDP